MKKTAQHYFNPDQKYGVNRMRIEARKRAEREGRISFIHAHEADTHCNENCEKIGPEDAN